MYVYVCVCGYIVFIHKLNLTNCLINSAGGYRMFWISKLF